MAAPAHPPEFRPYRVALYAIFLAFTLTFIWCIGHSVWVELYTKDETGKRTDRPTVASCSDDLDVLYRRLAARSTAAVAPNANDWNGFVAEFEGKLAQFKARCVEGEVEGSDSAIRAALADAADRLDNMREHLSRCGEEGEQEWAVLAKSIAELKVAVRARGR